MSITNINWIDLWASLKTIVPHMRRQIFRQAKVAPRIVLKFRRNTGLCQEILVQNDGKYASRWGAKDFAGGF